MTQQKALIPGVSGVVGRRLAEYLASTGDWEVVGLARRPPEAPAGYRALGVDLTDAAACERALRGFTDITHVLYCARYDHSTTAKEPIETNLAMLRNVLDAVEPVASGLRHVHLVHGSKYYGSELGPYKTPAKESDPRLLVDNWYYAQEDFVIARSEGKSWTWSASRPHGICDHAPGNARSMAMVIAVYAAISRELGQPLRFPGSAANFQAVYQVVDATLLAKAIAWIATRRDCGGQAFNVTNGDYIRWSNLWPRFADFFDMPVGPVKTIRLAQAMSDKAPVWDRIVKKHGLQPTPYERAALWAYGDFIFGSDHDMMSDTLKLRRSGFADCVDSEEMFLLLFAHFRRQKIIP